MATAIVRSSIALYKELRVPGCLTDVGAEGNRIPVEETSDQREKVRRRREACAGRGDVADELRHPFGEFAVLPEVKLVAV